jgi:hypothetical protein
MKILFVATFSPIVSNPAMSQAFYPKDLSPNCAPSFTGLTRKTAYPLGSSSTWCGGCPLIALA